MKEKEKLRKKVERMIEKNNQMRRGMGIEEIEVEKIIKEMNQVEEKIMKYIDKVWSVMEERRKDGESIMFEGEKGEMIENDKGKYKLVKY